MGEELGVDAVVMYCFELTRNEGDMNIFTIDIHNKKEYKRSVSTEGEFSSGEGYNEELETTTQIFSNYKRDIR